MPANYPRIEIDVGRERKHKLELLKKEARVRTGRTVSIRELVSSILDDFFERNPIKENKST